MKSACLKLAQSLADCVGSPGCDEPGVEFDHCGEASKINQSYKSVTHSISIYIEAEVKYSSKFSSMVRTYM